MRTTHTLFIVFIGLSIVAIAMSVVLLFTLRTQTNVQQTQVATLAPALYPLYDKAAWSDPHTDVFTLPDGTHITGAHVDAQVATSTMNPGSFISPFKAYYRDKLRSLGWTVDNSLAANGPASGQEVYRKGSELVALLFDTTFSIKPTNAPEQCPCSVTLALFSTTDTSSNVQ